MKTIIENTINGFIPAEIRETMDILKQDPSLAKFQFRVNNQWVKGGHNQSQIKGFYGAGTEDNSRTSSFVYDNGEPPILLGNNEGANPVEYVLHALAGCMTTTMVLHAAARGIEIGTVTSTLEGDIDIQGFLGLDESVRNGYQNIRITFHIDGELSDEQKAELISFTDYSPVFDIVTNRVPVQVQLS